MKFKIAGTLIVVFTIIAMQGPLANAQTPEVTTTTVAVDEVLPSTYESMLATLKSLLAKVAELQAQLAKVTGQVEQLLGDDIAEGVSSDDVKTMQELLATDPDIYPEGFTTGYFGPLTKKAIERFQEKHELGVTGMVDEDTRELMEAFLESDDDGDEDHVSEGLLKRLDILKTTSPTGCEKAKTLCLTPMMDELDDLFDDDSDGMMDSDDDKDMMDDSDSDSDSDDDEDDEDDSGDDKDEMMN